MKSRKKLSLNDFVSAQVDKLHSFLKDHPTHPLEKISLILAVLSNILVRKQEECQGREGLTIENGEFVWRLTFLMKVIQPFLNNLTVKTHGMTEHKNYNTGEGQPWTKTIINRALVDLRELGIIVIGLTSFVMVGPMEEFAYFLYKTLEHTRRRTLNSIWHLWREMTLLLRQIDFRHYLDNTSKAVILANCPDDHCAICLVQKLTVDTEFTVLNCCRHIFCTWCIKTWLENENWCPMCHRNVDWTEAFSKSKYIRCFKYVLIAAIPMLLISLNQILYHGTSTVMNFLLSNMFPSESVPDD